MKCTLCPRSCGAERDGKTGAGFCRMPAGLRVARAALHAAHYGYVLQTGEITMQGSGEALLRDESVQEAYLGHKSKH